MKLLGNTKHWLKDRHLNIWLRQKVKPVFVLSTGRCGTKLLSQLINESKDAQVTHEPYPCFLGETKSVYQADGEAAYGKRVVQQYAVARWRFLYDAASNHQVYMECSNRLTYLAYSLREYFPDARFIHMYRNPYDVIRSGIRRGYYTGDHPWDKYRITPREKEMSADQWAYLSSFEKTCWYWAAVNDWILKFLEVTNRSAVYNLKAEDLFNDPLGEVQKLCGWLEIQKPGSEYIRTTGRVRINAQVEGVCPHWSEWSEKERQTVSKLTGPVARRLGYSGLT